MKDDGRETLQYVCNVYLKYLETLYSINTGKKQDQIQQELRTIEGILLTQMKASFEQTKKIEDLIRQFIVHQKQNFLVKSKTFFTTKKNPHKPQNFELALN